MKEVTLKFRETSVDGLPEKSGDYVVVHQFHTGEMTADHYMYSEKYKAFNVHDSAEDDHNRIGNNPYWMPEKEFEDAFKEATDENLD